MVRRGVDCESLGRGALRCEGSGRATVRWAAWVRDGLRWLALGHVVAAGWAKEGQGEGRGGVGSKAAAGTGAEWSAGLAVRCELLSLQPLVIARVFRSI